MNRISILIAEDEESDVFFMKRAFEKVALPNPAVYVPDGMAAIEFLSRAKSHPDERLPGLVVLDLKMPRRNGLQVLEWMRAEPVIRAIPALVFSSSANQNDVEAAYDRGASGFMIKPPSSAERAEFATFIKDWLRCIQPPLIALEGFKAALAQRGCFAAPPNPAKTTTDSTSAPPPP
jgi:CheY-like chemotaxis protein